MNNNEIASDAEEELYCRFCHQDVEENEWNWEFSICDACRTEKFICYCDYCDEMIQMTTTTEEEEDTVPEGECFPLPPNERGDDPDLYLCPECVPIYINNYPNWQTYLSDYESDDENENEKNELE